ncbi:MAG: hypothetical protein RLY97_1961 [Pseudomonadota bacterium]
MTQKSRRLPTTDLYFRYACADYLDHWWRHGPLKKRGENCYTHGDCMVLIRQDSDKIMQAALDWPGRLAYVVDDDIAGAATSPQLPPNYRDRLAGFDHSFHQALVQRADRLLVSSDALAQIFAHHRHVQRLDPCWNLALANQNHYAPFTPRHPLRLIHLGSASHNEGLSGIIPVINALLDRDNLVEFTYFSRDILDQTLEIHPRARRLRPKSWPNYRRWIAHQRYHLALYPLGHAKFDQARSCNKLHEHGIIGAVGIYPEGWQARHLLDGHAFTAPDDPSDWADTLETAIAMRDQLPDIAKNAAQSLSRHNHLSMQRQIWCDFFGLHI